MKADLNLWFRSHYWHIGYSFQTTPQPSTLTFLYVFKAEASGSVLSLKKRPVEWNKPGPEDMRDSSERLCCLADFSPRLEPSDISPMDRPASHQQCLTIGLPIYLGCLQNNCLKSYFDENEVMSVELLYD